MKLKNLDFADVDGDGIVEMVQTLSFDDEDLDAMGYSSVTKKPDERHLVCRLLKWDAEKERILQVDERLVAWKRPSYSDAS